jgi:hypothetical protein
MDSKIVSTEIRRRVWPLLRDARFEIFRSRSAWRHAGQRIEVLNIRSYNSYNASVLGCTTYSCSVNLGTYRLEIPPHFEPSPIKSAKGKLLPEEYDCHLRGGLRRSFVQPELEGREIWYVDPEGRYLERVIEDVRTAIVREALPWYERLREPAEVLRILLHEPQDMKGVWGFGNNPSPMRSYMTGYMARSLGDHDLARRSLRAVLQSQSFLSVHSRIAQDIEACGPMVS